MSFGRNIIESLIFGIRGNDIKYGDYDKTVSFNNNDSNNQSAFISVSDLINLCSGKLIYSYMKKILFYTQIVHGFVSIVRTTIKVIKKVEAAQLILLAHVQPNLIRIRAVGSKCLAFI